MRSRQKSVVFCWQTMDCWWQVVKECQKYKIKLLHSSGSYQIGAASQWYFVICRADLDELWWITSKFHGDNGEGRHIAGSITALILLALQKSANHRHSFDRLYCSFMACRQSLKDYHWCCSWISMKICEFSPTFTSIWHKFDHVCWISCIPQQNHSKIKQAVGGLPWNFTDVRWKLHEAEWTVARSLSEFLLMLPNFHWALASVADTLSAYCGLRQWFFGQQ